MKTILLMAAVFAIAGCEKKGTTSGADTSAAMAPAMSDSMGMTHSDSTMARDTAQK
jgi:predicted small lipoprotein YifL